MFTWYIFSIIYFQPTYIFIFGVSWRQHITGSFLKCALYQSVWVLVENWFPPEKTFICFCQSSGGTIIPGPRLSLLFNLGFSGHIVAEFWPDRRVLFLLLYFLFCFSVLFCMAWLFCSSLLLCKYSQYKVCGSLVIFPSWREPGITSDSYVSCGQSRS